MAKDLRNFSNKDIRRILQRIEALKTDPRPPGCEKLQERYRLRQGAYRIIYEIRDHKLIIIAVVEKSISVADSSAK